MVMLEAGLSGLFTVAANVDGIPEATKGEMVFKIDGLK